jgi:hypothetical protein
MNPNNQSDGNKTTYVPTITTTDRPSWEQLIRLGREVGAGTVLDSLHTTQIGCVYVINAIGTKHYKIGFSSTPGTDDRIRNMQTGNAHELECILELPTFHYRYIEKFLHIVFKSKRIRGEWFKLNKADLKMIEEIFNSYK